MKKISLVMLMSIVLAGCGGGAKNIALKTHSERRDVFTEVTDGGARPQGFADMTVKANIKG